MFRGSRIFMLLFGLILGLGIAGGVTWFVTQVPMPFTDKFSRADPTQPLPDLRQAPDPNQALSGRSEPVTPVSGTAPAPQTGTAPAPNLQDDIGALLTTLGAPPTSAPTAASSPGKPAAPPQVASAASPVVPATPAPRSTAPAATPATTAPAPAATPKAAPGTQTPYYLQAGAFRAEADAQAMQARILMMGLQSTVQPVQSNGTTLHRVRVGPFKGIDEMNRSRATLSNAKIDTTVVRP